MEAQVRCEPTGKVLLTDEQVKQFIREGYLYLTPQLDQEFHASIYQTIERIFKEESNPGNNILPRLPKLHHVFDDPVVSGAITSLLGPRYLLHPHRHPHQTPPGKDAQNWHKDSYFGFRIERHHRLRWIMAMYYPQDTPFELGPTGILPTSQYYATASGDKGRRFREAPADWLVQETPAVCKAGTVILIHYDI